MVTPSSWNLSWILTRTLSPMSKAATAILEPGEKKVMSPANKLQSQWPFRTIAASNLFPGFVVMVENSTYTPLVVGVKTPEVMSKAFPMFKVAILNGNT